MTDLQLVLLDQRRARATDPETSKVAAQRQGPRLSLIAVIVEGCGARGATADDISRELSHIAPDTVKSAVSRTSRRGLIVDSGRKRPSNRGGPMIVYTHPRWAS